MPHLHNLPQEWPEHLTHDAKIHPVYSMPNLVGASPRAAQIGELAAEYISAIKAMIDELIAEAESLCFDADPAEKEARAAMVLNDLAFLNATVDASSKSLTSAWSDITAARTKLITKRCR